MKLRALFTQVWVQVGAASACACLTVASHAACVNPLNPAESPVSGVKTFFDIHLPARPLAKSEDEKETVEDSGRRSYNWPTHVVQAKYGLPTFERAAAYSNDPNENFRGKPPYDDLAGIAYLERQGEGNISEKSDGRPPYVWPNHIDPTQFDRKEIAPEGGAVYFYEPDGKGGRRLCRMERWLSRSMEITRDMKVIPRTPQVTVAASPNQTRNPALAALSKDYFFVGYSNLRYNAQGRLPHIGPVCFYYTPDGQVSWLAYESPKGECLGKKPDPRQESFIEVLFDDKGKGIGSVLSRPQKWHLKDDPTTTQEYASSDPKGWLQTWVFRHGGGEVSAMADDRVGVRALEVRGSLDVAAGTLGAKDDTPYNEFRLGEESPFAMGREQSYRRYEFPKPVPTALLRNPETLYQYERVRLTGRVAVVLERFAAGSNKLVARAWRLSGSNSTAREEKFNAEGKLVRAVAVDFLLNSNPKRPPWAEDFAQYKSQITATAFENVYLRVYDYDASGKESLVGIGWTNFPREKFFEHQSGSRRARLNEYKDSIAKIMGKPLEKREPIPAELTYYFGTPDGKVSWADYAAFNKAFGPFQDGDAEDVIFPTGRRSGSRQ